MKNADLENELKALKEKRNSLMISHARIVWFLRIWTLLFCVFEILCLSKQNASNAYMTMHGIGLVVQVFFAIRSWFFSKTYKEGGPA
jgi:hypothetical protein